jgi:uncharacterized protein (DUF1778 family)
LSSGEKRNVGRPKGTVGAYKDIKKSVQVAFRVTPEEKEIILKKAAEANLSLSEYLIKVSLG